MNLINKFTKHKRGIALGMALLMGGSMIIQNLTAIKTYAEVVGSIQYNYWNSNSGPMDYYGKKGRNALWRLQLSDGKAAICLDATKALNRGKAGTIISSTYEAGTFPTGVSRDGAEYVAY